ncbi:MAG TPA: 4Fe-4S double cluster binding domain-containing protein [Acidimicrobiia bacterium]|nr:4Fe-4S double cluster binding domain-containing protein [Acidimicrobiia bacterium]
MSDRLTEELSEIAAEHGAVGFGVGGVEPFDRDRQAIRARTESGMAGPLRFTYGDPDRATDITGSFPWARRLVTVAFDYLPSSRAPARSGAVVGRFATADHYRGLRHITAEVAGHLVDRGHRAVTLIDDNRLVDRAAAVRSGVGWPGRSTMTLVPGHGPWVLLGSVVTDAPLELTAPMTRTCGTCIACFPACPTGALTEIGLDARRCLSTWLQSAGSIPHWIRPVLGRRVYGCDDCLTSCPPGRRAIETSGGNTDILPFAELLASSDHALLERFRWWYVPRRDGRYLRRNLLVAAGNSGEPEARGAIEDHMGHPSSMIRSHAVWAWGRSLGIGAAPGLRSALESETAPETRDELTLALLMVEDPTTHRDVLAADEWARGHGSVRAVALTLADPARPGEGVVLHLIGDVPTGSRPKDGPVPIEIHADVGQIGVGSATDSDLVTVYDPDHVLRSWGRKICAGTRLQA